MREILFRGKRKDNGEWVAGSLISFTGSQFTAIFSSPSFSCSVDPETVGQYTGLTDKNGNKIFEGDIIEHDHPYGRKSVHTVIWDKYRWNLSDFYATYFDEPGEAFSEGTQCMTIIGNIYDNPKLMEVKQNEM